MSAFLFGSGFCFEFDGFDIFYRNPIGTLSILFATATKNKNPS